MKGLGAHSGPVRAAEQIYTNGDMVFYKREGKEKWLGPGKVVFQDGKVVFVRHGSVFVRVSPNRLCKINSVESDEDGSRLDIVSSGNNAGQLEHKDISYAENRELIEETETEPESIFEEIPSSDKPRTATETQRTERPKLKINDKIQYKVNDTDEWVKAKVMSRAGKATGKYKDWYNIQDDGSNEQKSIDMRQYIWKKVTNVDNNITNDVHVVTSKVQDNETEFAKATELSCASLIPTER